MPDANNSKDKPIEFYAVTQSKTLYLVRAERDEDGVPIVERIAELFPSRSFKLGDRLKGGGYILISREFNSSLQLISRCKLPLGEIKNVYVGDGTSPIVGLFFDKDKAEECRKSTAPTIFDSRWHQESREVLKAIEENEIFDVRVDLDYLERRDER